MSDQGEQAAERRSVVFHAFWSDTTRHGIMVDYQASPEPVSLLKASADAAIAAGKATLWTEDRASEGEAAE